MLKQKAVAAYKNASNDCKVMLKSLFGEDLFKQTDNIECIRTFSDAARAVGIVDVEDWEENYANLEPDILAYFKLRIICKALNEGWVPTFKADETRYYPWFWLYTQDEINNMKCAEKQKRNLQLCKIGDYAGFAFAYSYNVPSCTGAYVGSRLCLKSDELAEYCGKQFIEDWLVLITGMDYSDINTGE